MLKRAPLTTAFRPAEHAERSLLRGILDRSLPPGSALPPERELAGRLGITRPTLREALQRLHRDGWLEIRQGRPTRVLDFWKQGGLNVLSALVREHAALPARFVTDLLDVREALAPAYARSAVARDAPAVREALAPAVSVKDAAADLARFDWSVHRALAALSGNPIHTLILNGFAGFYETAATRYFARAEARASSRSFWKALDAAAAAADAERAERVTRSAMAASTVYWRSAQQLRRGARR